MSLSQKFKEKKNETVIKRASELFSVSQTYVYQIVSGERKATRGKGLEVKNWLEKEL